jgi:hypothetical protein
LYSFKTREAIEKKMRREVPASPRSIGSPFSTLWFKHTTPPSTSVLRRHDKYHFAINQWGFGPISAHLEIERLPE